MLDLNQYSHSHDTLEIVQYDQVSCVRKIFRGDLERALRNVEKQRMFRPIDKGIARLSAADVLEFEIKSDHAKLLMPYIEGITGHMFPVHATRKIARTLSVSLSTMLYYQLDESIDRLVETRIFHDKLVEVLAATRDQCLKRLIDAALDIVLTLPYEINFPIGPCHGDLTLSNVIFDSVSGITLIDFLDTFLESPLQDVAKLKQDYVYGWSFRNDQPVHAIKAEIMCRHHFPEAIINIEKMYPTQIRLLTLMALVRIAPYVRDGATQKWLANSLTKCLGDIA
jgi:hypothetical protein